MDSGGIFWRIFPRGTACRLADGEDRLQTGNPCWLANLRHWGSVVYSSGVGKTVLFFPVRPLHHGLRPGSSGSRSESLRHHPRSAREFRASPESSPIFQLSRRGRYPNRRRRFHPFGGGVFTNAVVRYESCPVASVPGSRSRECKNSVSGVFRTFS